MKVLSHPGHDNYKYYILGVKLNNHSHLGSPSPSNPHEGQLGQRPTSGLYIAETQSSHVLNDSVWTIPLRV